MSTLFVWNSFIKTC